MYLLYLQHHYCYDLKLKLRLYLGKDLRKDKGCIEVVKHKDTGQYLHCIYWLEVKQCVVHEVDNMRRQ